MNILNDTGRFRPGAKAAGKGNAFNYYCGCAVEAVLASTGAATEVACRLAGLVAEYAGHWLRRQDMVPKETSKPNKKSFFMAKC